MASRAGASTPRARRSSSASRRARRSGRVSSGRSPGTARRRPYMRLVERTRPYWSRIRSVTLPPWLGPLGREPWIVLGPLVLVQWLALAVFMVTVRHNSWLYYQGGDQTFYYSTGWMF